MPHAHASTGARLGLSVALTLTFVVVEGIAGCFANSLALLSDAGHNFADALALVFSWYALRMAHRPADARRTFGYHRVGVLAALVNAVSLVVLALLIFWEAAQRLESPQHVEAGLMIGVALAAVAVNGVISFWLHQAAKHDLNVRSAYLHMLGDAASALGVVAAGVVTALTGATIADPLVSFLIGGLILASSWGILREAVDVLLEAAPRRPGRGRAGRGPQGRARRPQRPRPARLDGGVRRRGVQLSPDRTGADGAVRPASAAGGGRPDARALRSRTRHDSGGSRGLRPERPVLHDSPGGGVGSLFVL